MWKLILASIGGLAAVALASSPSRWYLSKPVVAGMDGMNLTGSR